MHDEPVAVRQIALSGTFLLGTLLYASSDTVIFLTLDDNSAIVAFCRYLFATPIAFFVCFSQPNVLSSLSISWRTHIVRVGFLAANTLLLLHVIELGGPSSASLTYLFQPIMLTLVASLLAFRTMPGRVAELAIIIAVSLVLIERIAGTDGFVVLLSVLTAAFCSACAIALCRLSPAKMATPAFAFSGTFGMCLLFLAIAALSGQLENIVFVGRNMLIVAVLSYLANYCILHCHGRMNFRLLLIMELLRFPLAILLSAKLGIQYPNASELTGYVCVWLIIFSYTVILRRQEVALG